MKLKKYLYLPLLLVLFFVVSCSDSSDSTDNSENSSDNKNIRTLVDPEYTYTDDFEAPLDTIFWNKTANNNDQAVDPADSTNHVIESLYGDEQAKQGDGDSWSELSGELPFRAVQLEFGFREYTPASYNVSYVKNHKSVAAHSGTYGVYNSNISISSECWPKDGGATPSIYTGYDGTNRGHIMSPDDPLLWQEGDGNWHDVHVFIQLAEKPGEYGFYELYRDGELLISNQLEAMPDSWDSTLAKKLIGYVTRGNYLDEIRLYGWANNESGYDAFAEPTHFLHDDFYLHANSVHSETTGGSELDKVKETAIVLFSFDFLDNKAPLQGDGLSYGSANGGSMDFSNGYLSAYYPAVAGNSNWWGMDVLDKQTSEIFVEFDARMPNNKHGFKFLKIFGEKDTNGGYSNVTFGLDYTGIDNGAMLCVSFGDGSTTQNDTANLIWLDGHSPSSVGRSYNKTAHVVTPQKKSFASSDWGSDWHHFKMYWKFDTATTIEEETNNNREGKANGACYLEIDGKPYVLASGLLNRHFTNSLFIKSVALTNWTQNNDDTDFIIEYDNIKVTTGGFAD